MSNEPLVIKRRADDGTKVISVRVQSELLKALDKISADTNYSRNEIINMILQHGVENLIIK